MSFYNEMKLAGTVSLKDVSDAVLQVVAMAMNGDNEGAHVLEDDIRLVVLEVCAGRLQSDTSHQVLAVHAVSTMEFDFKRHCA